MFGFKVRHGEKNHFVRLDLSLINVQLSTLCILAHLNPSIAVVVLVAFRFQSTQRRHMPTARNRLGPMVLVDVLQLVSREALVGFGF
jgi:hypothetical protein